MTTKKTRDFYTNPYKVGIDQIENVSRESKLESRVIVHDAVERAKAQMKGYGRAYG